MDFRFNRWKMAKACAGKNWGAQYDLRPQKVNLLSLYQTIVPARLIPKTPRFMLYTPRPEYTAAVASLQALVNKCAEKSNLADILKRIVVDATYSLGIAKVALTSMCESSMGGWVMKPGQPKVTRIDLDDFVYDRNAQTFEEASFIGHRYRCPLEVAQAMYRKHADYLRASTQYDYNPAGDERIGKIGRESYGYSEFEPHVELWEIYLPRHKVVVTLADGQVAYSSGSSVDEPLWIQEWVGPEKGPYHFLGYGVVPGNAMPKAPMMDLYDLHEDANAAYRKANNMIRRLKEMTVVKAGNDRDAEEIKKAIDGALIGLDNPDMVKPLVTGGNAVQVVLQIATAYKDLFSFMGGNLELLGGRSPQSGTAHQDQMLNENAAAGLAEMQESTVGFVSSVGQALAEFYTIDPVSIQQVSEPIDGVEGESIQRTLLPWNYSGPMQGHRRTFTIDDYDCRVDPYSMRYQTPVQRREFLIQMMTQVITPMLPILMQQQLGPDMAEFLRIVGELSDFKDIQRIMGVQSFVPGDQGASEMPHDRTLPVATERNYTRTSIPQDTPSSDQNLMAALGGIDMGGAPSLNGAGMPSLIGSV